MTKALLLTLLSAWTAHADTFPTASAPYESQVVLSGLRNPWAVVPGPNADLYVLELGGAIHVVRNGQIAASLSGLPSSMARAGQGGLMDLAFHPHFATNSFVYLSYVTRQNAVPANGANTRISRFRLVGTQLQDETILLQGGFGTDGAHFGSRLAFGNDGKLYASFGERHHKEKAQELGHLNGKIVRINDDGTIPGDNPFVNTAGALGAIFTLGHRNPQGLAVHPDHGYLVNSEHGPTGYDASIPGHGSVGLADEVNLLRSGGNFGWPLVYGDPQILPWTPEMHRHAREKNLVMPIQEFTEPDGIAPSGIAFYTGQAFPRWSGDLFVSALRGYLVRMKLSRQGELLEQEQLPVLNSWVRVRDVATGADGLIYVVVDSGRLILLRPHP